MFAVEKDYLIPWRIQHSDCIYIWCSFI